MNKVMFRQSGQYSTDFLFPRTSFLVGMGSVLNISGRYFDFNYSTDGEDPDSKALENDWGMIGQDIAKEAKKEQVADSVLCNG